MIYGIEEARHQYEALRGAAEVSPVLQCRAQLAQQGREWRDAGTMLKMLSEENTDSKTGAITWESNYGIVVAGSVVGGMILASEKDEQDATVIRTMARDSQFSIHVTNTRYEAGTYMNLVSASSPVVARVR